MKDCLPQIIDDNFFDSCEPLLRFFNPDEAKFLSDGHKEKIRDVGNGSFETGEFRIFAAKLWSFNPGEFQCL